MKTRPGHDCRGGEQIHCQVGEGKRAVVRLLQSGAPGPRLGGPRWVFAVVAGGHRNLSGETAQKHTHTHMSVQGW